MPEIVTYPDERLRRHARGVEQFDDRFRAITADMAAAMEQAHGVGLAAPQIGVNLRFALIDTRPVTQADDRAGLPAIPHPLEARMPLVIVNPRIVESGGSQLGQEGCLSIPEVWGDVDRRQWIQVEAVDEFGGPLEFEVSDFFARVVQHEMDHLDGVLFIDHLDREDLRENRSVLRTLEREARRGVRRRQAAVR